MSSQLTEDIAVAGRIDVVPKILEVICRTTGMGFAAVARVTEDRWIACAVQDEIEFGLKPGGELQVKTTICDEIRQSGVAVVIDHVAEDPAFAAHHTPRQYGFQSYISVPILRGGAFFGTLCAIDPRPARLKTPEVVGMFELFAELIGRHLDAEARLAESEAALIDAQAGGELRDQFIAVLGHDLRNPLASIAAAARLVSKTPLNERAQMLMGHMQASVLRMAGLIDNVLDFARGRLGGGFAVERWVDPGLGEALEQVVAELRGAHPDRVVDAEFDLAAPVAADSRRLAQALSNLLGNALTHGAADQPVRVTAVSRPDGFEMAVANHGPPIPDALRGHLFQPFSRGSANPHQQGLGLGLYITAEIARAHGGTVELTSDETETRFVLSIPAGAAPAT